MVVKDFHPVNNQRGMCRSDHRIVANADSFTPKLLGHQSGVLTNEKRRMTKHAGKKDRQIDKTITTSGG